MYSNYTTCTLQVLFFFSFTEEGFIDAAEAGATVHLGPPLVDMPSECPPYSPFCPPANPCPVRFGPVCNQTLIQRLASYDPPIGWLTLASNYGGAINTAYY